MLFRWLARQWVQATAQRVVSDAMPGRSRAPADAEQPLADEAGEGAAAAESQQPMPYHLPHCDVAVICGDSVESSGLRKLMDDVVTTRCPRLLEHAGQLAGRRLIIAESGTGTQQAMDATDDIIQMHKPGLVIAAGFATALDESMQHFHLLMGDPVQDAAGEQFQLGSRWDEDQLAAMPDLHLGPLLSLPEIITSLERRKELAEQYDALAVDMESLAIARSCRQHQTSCMTVRVITEMLTEEFPAEVTGLAGQQTTARKLGAFARALVHRPSSVKDMWRLKNRAYKASEKLGRFLVSLIGQLPVK
jgi:adenosylhomocysteine nucleosidase